MPNDPQPLPPLPFVEEKLLEKALMESGHYYREVKMYLESWHSSVFYTTDFGMEASGGLIPGLAKIQCGPYRQGP